MVPAGGAVACRCAPGILNEDYAYSEVVVYARVRKTYPNTSRDNPYYRIEFDPIRTFKGRTVKELFVFGSMDGTSRTDCDLYVREGSVWIIFASMWDGVLQFGMCSASEEIHRRAGFSGNAVLQKSLERKLDALEVLGRTAGSVTYQDPASFIFCNGSYLLDFLKTYDGNKRIKRPFVQYLIEFNDDLKVGSVRALYSLNRRFDRKLTGQLKGKSFCPPRSASEQVTKHPVLLGIYCIDDRRGGVILNPAGP